MRKILLNYFLIPAFLFFCFGCVPLLIGGAVVGAAGAYAISKDTVQGETEKHYEDLWYSAIEISKIKGTIKFQDDSKGYIEVDSNSNRVSINLIRMTRSITRIRIASRKLHLPNLSLAQEFYTKIVENAN